MRRNLIIGSLVFMLGSFLLAGPLAAQNRPHGLYAKIDITSEINSHSNKTPAEFETYLIQLYQDMLINPAVSGLAIQAHWDQLNPNPGNIIMLHPPPQYDWTYLDDAFTQVSVWNEVNPQSLKTIQFIITPGFQSPQWLFDEIPSCDGLFEKPTVSPSSDCGRVTFAGYKKEEQDSTQLPLPWNPVYKSAWQTFLVALNERYGTNPWLVSIAVAGPTAASEEMILPHNGNTPKQTFGSSTISPNEMWLALFAFHYPGMTDYQKSDQAFIDEWEAAIDMYGETFTGLTLVATTGSGLPDFGTTATLVVPTLPIDFTNDCGNITMDCAAETTILSHFVSASVGGSNAKATQTSGVKASSAHTTDLGLDGVKLVSATTATFSPPSAQILGGAQFTTSVSQKPETEGSSSIVEQAFYNVLRVIFTGTPAGGWYCEPTNLKDLPTAPLNYVQIYSNDFLYAATNSMTSVPVDEGTCHGTHSLSAQEELNTASLLLIFISEPEFTGF